VTREAPGVGCGAAILRDGRILLALRRKPPEAGLWSLPGGKVDFLERVEDAIVREVREEIGVEIALSRLLLVSQLIGVDGQHWVSPVYLAAIVSGDPENREPGKTQRVEWFAMDAAPANLAQAAREAIGALLDGLEDLRLVETVKARAHEIGVRVDIDDL
jgi:ADP-ribose pyrophosphatase YjhB (NUDIX family)